MTDRAVPLRLDANLGWLFTELPFEQRFDAAAAAGFGGVECASPYGFPAPELRKRLDNSGLTQVLINVPVGQQDSGRHYGVGCRPDSIAEFRGGALRALEYASVLGAGLVHVLAGIRPPEVPHATAMATYQDNLAWAVDQAAATGITLVVELINQRDAPGFVLSTVEEAAAVVAAVDHPQLRLMFDLYHVQVAQGDVTTRLRALLPYVAHLQIADPPGRGEPGSGELGWEYLFRQIVEAGYPGWIGCEYRPVADTVVGLCWRSRFGLC